MFFFLFFSCQTDYKTFNSTPSALISSHVDGDTMLLGYPEALRGQVSDPNHPFEQLKAAWFVDGAILCDWGNIQEDGSTSCPYMPQLLNQSIALRVQDPLGEEAIDSIQIQVNDSVPPTVQIVSPVSGDVFDDEQKIVFTAMVADAEDLPTDLQLHWTSDIVGDLELSTQADSLGQFSEGRYLTPGTHLIELKVTDSQEKIATKEVEIVVVDAENPPVCELLAPFDDSAHEAGQEIYFTAQVSDQLTSPEQLTVTWASDLDGELGVLSADSQGYVNWSAADLGLGSHRITITVVDEAGLMCMDDGVLHVSQKPTAVIQEPITGQLYNLGEPIYFSAQVVDDDTPAEQLDIVWESDVDGVLHTGPLNSAGVAGFSSYLLQAGVHTVSLIATDQYGFGHFDTVQFRVNTPPEQPIVDISPLSPKTEDALQVILTGVTDADGDAVSTMYRWSRDGALTNYLTDSIPATATAKGELWRVEVYLDDGYATGLSAYHEVTIGNTEPVIDSVTIAPSSGYDNSSFLSCAASASDPDESVQLIYQWENQSTGVAIGAGATLQLDASMASPNDTIICRVYAVDSSFAQDEQIASVLLDNRTPQISSLQVIPSEPTTSDSLACSFAASDADQDALTSSIEWVDMASNAVLGSGAYLLLTPTLTSPNAQIGCVVTVVDQHGAQAQSSTTVVIRNTPPQIVTAAITPSNAVNTDQLSCSVTAIDSDGDVLTTEISWYHLATSALLGSQDSLTLEPSLVVAGDVVVCQVVITDTYGAQAFQELYLSVGNAVPVFQENVAIQPAADVTVEQELQCLATVVDDDSHQLTTNYVWKNEVTGDVLGYDASLQLSAALAQPSDEISCTMVVTDELGASIEGSASVGVINSPPQIISLQLLPENPTIHDEISVDYQIVDADGDPVSLQYDWFIDGSLAYQNIDTLSSGLVKHTEIVLQVTPNDGRENGEIIESNLLVIANSTPTVPVIQLLPTEPNALFDDLVCEVQTMSTDADGDALSYEIAWYQNQTVWVGGVEQLVYAGDSIPSAEVTAGDDWACQVRVFDGEDYSSPIVSNEVHINDACYLTTCDFTVAKMDFIEVDAGVFLMGSGAQEAGRSSDEELHVVELTEDFYMMTTEVTQEQFEDVMGYNPSMFQGCGLSCPVEQVSWSEAAYFSNQISQAEGLQTCYSCVGSPPQVSCTSISQIYQCSGYRLPTEAEWEYAVRSGVGSSFWTFNGGASLIAGDEYSCVSSLVLSDGSMLQTNAWYCGNNGTISAGTSLPKSVATRQANGWGLYDLHGNVWEWVHDDYEQSLGTGLSVNPVMSANGAEQVIRGGAYDSEPRFLRSAERQPSSTSTPQLGFRLVVGK